MQWPPLPPSYILLFKSWTNQRDWGRDQFVCYLFKLANILITGRFAPALSHVDIPLPLYTHYNLPL